MAGNLRLLSDLDSGVLETAAGDDTESAHTGSLLAALSFKFQPDGKDAASLKHAHRLAQGIIEPRLTSADGAIDFAPLPGSSVKPHSKSFALRDMYQSHDARCTEELGKSIEGAIAAAQKAERKLLETTQEDAELPSWMDEPHVPAVSGDAELALLPAAPFLIDDPRFEKLRSIADQPEFALNVGQRRVFMLFHHFLRLELLEEQKPKGQSLPVPQFAHQLFGSAGTGKSHLIKAIVELFRAAGRRHWLAVTATTGSAAAGILGKTIHSLLNLRKDDHCGTAASRHTNRLKQCRSPAMVRRFQMIKFIIVDEISVRRAALPSCSFSTCCARRCVGVACSMRSIFDCNSCVVHQRHRTLAACT